MCRMLMFQGIYTDEYWEFFKALVESAKCDRILGKYRDKEYEQHRDGWGIVIVYHDELRYFLYKSINPIFEEEETLKRILKHALNKRVSIITHARNAGTFSKNIESVHPFSYVTNVASTIFVAHNGSISKDFFKGDLNLEPIVIEKLCDSHLFTMWIAERWNSLEEAIRQLIDSQNARSLNVFMIEINEKHTNPILYALSYINENYLRKKGKPEEKIKILRNYYRVYYYSNEKVKVFVSSTLLDYIESIPKTLWKTMNLTGELIKIADDKLTKTLVR